MPTLIALPILAALLILQTALISRIPLLNGTTDLVLLAILAWALQKRVSTAWHWCIIGGLLVNLVSSIPLGVPLAGYALATGLALLLRQRVWQAPILAMFVATFAGTLISQGINLVALLAVGYPLPILDSFNLVILPSMLLNILLAIPAYALFGDLAGWLHPEPIEI
jgi:rod shape-determining protein MreD